MKIYVNRASKQASEQAKPEDVVEYDENEENVRGFMLAKATWDSQSDMRHETHILWVERL